MVKGQKPQRYFLVGPMGVGKTTIGKLLANTLKMPFIDADVELEQRLGVTIAWVFDIEGEVGFREREKALIDDLTKIPEIVLSTGGGAILDPDNRKHLIERGTVIYLSASVDTIFKRTKYDKKRPLLQTGNRRKRIQALLQSRDALYREAADIVIQSDKKSAKQVVKQILDLIVQPVVNH